MWSDPLWTNAGVLALVGVAFLVAGMVKGVIGLGLPMVSIGIMTAVLDVPTALPIAVLPVIVLNLIQAVQGVTAFGMLRRFAWLFGLACVGIWLGTFLLFLVDPRITAAVLGTALLTYVLLSFFVLRLTISPAMERVLTPPVGLVGGVLLGMTGSLVIPVVLFIQQLKLDKDSFIQALGWLFFITALPWLVSLFQQDVYTWANFTLSAVAVIPALLGMALGSAFRGRISQETFRILVLVALAILALNLLRKAIF
jgi:uncharacterized membrane protein YfcA